MIRLLRPLLAPAVRCALRSRFSSPEIHGVLDDAFKDYEQQIASAGPPAASGGAS